MGRAAQEVEPAPAEARPEAHRRLRIVAGALHQIDAEPVRLDLGLADAPRIAAEIAEEAAPHPRVVEPHPVAEHIVREFVREHRRQLAVVGDIFRDRGADLDVSPVGAGVEAAAGDELEAGRAALLGGDLDGEPLGPAPDLDPRAAVGEGLVEGGEDAAPSVRTSRRGRASARGGARPSRASRMSSARRPARSAGPPAASASTPGPASSPKARIAAGRKSAPYCERSWSAKPGSQSRSAHQPRLATASRCPIVATRWSSARIAVSDVLPRPAAAPRARRGAVHEQDAVQAADRQQASPSRSFPPVSGHNQRRGGA